MRWLLDNNVPRSITWLLRDRGHDVVEVREVLGSSALDTDVRAYAVAESRILVTHDRGLARRCRTAGEPCLWLRCAEPDDRRHLDSHLLAITQAGGRGQLAAVIRRDGTLEIEVSSDGGRPV